MDSEDDVEQVVVIDIQPGQTLGALSTRKQVIETGDHVTDVDDEILIGVRTGEGTGRLHFVDGTVTVSGDRNRTTFNDDATRVFDPGDADTFTDLRCHTIRDRNLDDLESAVFRLARQQDGAGASELRVLVLWVPVC